MRGSSRSFMDTCKNCFVGFVKIFRTPRRATGYRRNQATPSVRIPLASHLRNRKAIMKIFISLKPEEYHALVKNVAEASPARRALSSAAILNQLEGDGISQAYEITCDELESRALLSAAKACSPSAAAKITRSLQMPETGKQPNSEPSS